MISIIIPTLNEEKYIGKTIKQFLPYKKKYKLEIIVSDGGSSDNTLLIARKFADIVVAAKKGERQNIPEGRNAGARKARGEIIMSLDADVIIPKKREFFNIVNKKFSTSEIVALAPMQKIYPIEANIIDKAYHLIQNAFLYSTHIIGFHMCRGECQIFRKLAYVNVGGYDEGFPVGEDHNLYYKLRKQGKIQFCRKLIIYCSPRRYRKWGYVKTNLVYLVEGIWIVLFKKSFMKKWPVVR